MAKKAKPGGSGEGTLDQTLRDHLRYQESFLSLLATNTTGLLGMVNRMMDQNEKIYRGLKELTSMRQRDNIVVNLDDIFKQPLDKEGPDTAETETVTEEQDPFREDPTDPVGVGEEVPPPSILDTDETEAADVVAASTQISLKAKRKTRN